MSEDLPRFFVPPAQWALEALTLEGDAATHLGRVLRARVGEVFLALDGEGSLARVRIEAVTRQAITGRVEWRGEARGELPHPVTLVAALTRGEKFEWLIQKATELGVAAICPVLTARTGVRLEGERALEKVRRWQAIAREAAEQCERGRMPRIFAPMPWREALGQGPGVRLVGAERSEAPALSSWLRGAPRGPAVMWIGPEGGWDPAELHTLVLQGVQPVQLGSRILRAETAALAALALLASWLEA